MNKPIKRNTARQWIEGSRPQLIPMPWAQRKLQIYEVIGQRLKMNYNEECENLPDRLQGLLEQLNRLPCPAKPES